jgi:hypothetical protein
MATDWKPRIEYNDGSAKTVTFSTMQKRLWQPGTFGEGGSKRVASGVGEGFVIRFDGLMRVTLLFTEAERVAVLAWLRWAMSTMQTFTFRFDAGDAATAVVCDLESPRMGERVDTPRDDNPQYMQLEITLRRTDGLEFDVRMF